MILFILLYYNFTPFQNVKTMDNTKGIGRPEKDTPSVKKGKNYFGGGWHQRLLGRVVSFAQCGAGCRKYPIHFI